MSKLTELTAVFLRERPNCRWGDTVVIECELPPAETIKAGQSELVAVDASSASTSGPQVVSELDPWGDGSSSFDDAPREVAIKVYNCPENDLTPYLSYRFYGTWTEYRNPRTNERQQQFQAKTYVLTRPYGRAGTIAWLNKCPNIGPGIARRLWEKFESQSIAILKDHPDVAAEAVKSGFTHEKALQASAWLKRHDALEACFVELSELLDGRGFPKTLPKRLVAEFSGQAPAVVKRNPHILRNFSGCGILKPDKLYLDLGGDPAAIKRQTLMCGYSLSKDREGHTWFSADRALAGIKEFLGSAELQGRKAILLGRRAGLLSTRRDSQNRLWVAEGSKARSEAKVAECVLQSLSETDPLLLSKFTQTATTITVKKDHTRCTRCRRLLTAATVHVLGHGPDASPYGPTCITRVSGGDSARVVSLSEWLADQPAETRTVVSESFAGHDLAEFENLWPDPSELKGLTDHQRQQYDLATTARIGILGGGPGTGKSFTARALIEAIVAKHGIGSVLVMAPTGKAAVRVTELLQSDQGGNVPLPIRARTIHSALGVKELSESGGWGFAHDETHPLEAMFIIVDETSMVDAGIMASLLRARPRGCHVLLIGDTNQLPPVSHGAPLRDMIAAGLPYGELTEIHRNAGTIVRACKAIREGRPFETDATLRISDTPPANLKLVHCVNNSLSAAAIIDTLRKLAFHGVNPVWDCQVLVAVNGDKKGVNDLSRVKLNERLQRELNPGGAQCAGSKFRNGDKIICLKNGFMPCLDDEDSPFFDPTANQDRNEQGKVYVANGEIGRVLGQRPKVTWARFEAPARVIVIPRGEAAGGGNGNGNGDSNDTEEKTDTGCNFDLAYAITTHKSQGSEFPFALVGLDDSRAAAGVCGREHVYTAISRAKRACILFGKMATAMQFCQSPRLPLRKTFLRELIEEGTRPAEQTERPANQLEVSEI